MTSVPRIVRRSPGACQPQSRAGMGASGVMGRRQQWRVASALRGHVTARLTNAPRVANMTPRVQHGAGCAGARRGHDRAEV
jgi:hypothetical protein